MSAGPLGKATCACDPMSAPFSCDTLFSSNAPDFISARAVSVCPFVMAMVKAVALAVQLWRLR